MTTTMKMMMMMVRILNIVVLCFIYIIPFYNTVSKIDIVLLSVTKRSRFDGFYQVVLILFVVGCGAGYEVTEIE